MKKSQLLKTKIVKYFIDAQKTSNLNNAIESAAKAERNIFLIDSWENYKLPINVEVIAKKNNIEVSYIDNDKKNNPVIYSVGNKHIVKIPNETKGRNRISLAHEIGHTLFRDGSKHKINVLSLVEIKAEEYICDNFSCALLMPTKQTIEYLKKTPNNNPWEILKYIEYVAEKFVVSLPAVISRIGNLDINYEKSLMFIHLKYFNNAFTNKDKLLRVRNCSSMGNIKNSTTWFNRSAKNIGLHSASILFDKWLTDRENMVGRYILSNDNCLDKLNNKNAKWINEKILLSVMYNGKWSNKECDMAVFNCLYVKRGWNKDEAYIISILKPA